MSRDIPIDPQAFIQPVEKEVKLLAEAILDGRCTTFEDYRHKTGQLKGLRAAMGHFQQAIRNEDDDDGQD